MVDLTSASEALLLVLLTFGVTSICSALSRDIAEVILIPIVLDVGRFSCTVNDAVDLGAYIVLFISFYTMCE